MGVRSPEMVLHAKQIIRRRSPLQTKHRQSSSSANSTVDIPRGHFAVYVGERQKKRFVVPLFYLKHPLFKDMLIRAAEEFGFDHPISGLTIPCNEDGFINLTTHLNSS